jgi:uroporphyrinogen-III synthase
MSRLIETYGGKPLIAPAMREVPLSSNPEALKFADALFSGKIDTMIFLTGVGATALSKVLHSCRLVADCLPIFAAPSHP